MDTHIPQYIFATLNLIFLATKPR